MGGDNILASPDSTLVTHGNITGAQQPTFREPNMHMATRRPKLKPLNGPELKKKGTPTPNQPEFEKNGHNQTTSKQQQSRFGQLGRVGRSRCRRRRASAPLYGRDEAGEVGQPTYRDRSRTASHPERTRQIGRRGRPDPTHGMAADHGGGQAGWDRARQSRAQDKGQARQA